MSLTRKVTSIVILVFLLVGLANLEIQHLVIMPSFLALEEEEANKNAQRALQAISRELDQISPSVSDWSIWTDTYNYVKGEMPEYVEANLDGGKNLETLEGMQINFLGIYDTSGKAVWNGAVDLNTGERVDLGALTETSLNKDHPLLDHPSLESEVKGIISTALAPMLLVAKPIVTNEREGPAVGAMVMGRLLDAAAIERLADQVQLPLSVSSVDQPVATDRIVDVKRDLPHTAVGLTETPERWQAESTIFDLFGKPVLALQVDTARDISVRGATAVEVSLWSLSATGLLMMVVLWLLLRRTILRPLSQLTDYALHIGADDNLHTHLNLQRGDEIGVLADTFDEMVDRLTEARRRLVDQSFRSGVAEMASGVLHNIGNAVTPLNVKLSILNRDLGAAPVAEMEQAATELGDSATAPERRGDLVQFVGLAGIELAGLVKRSREEVAAAAQQVVYVQEILADQERFSRSARVIEPVDMAAIIQDAVAGLSPEMKAAQQIEVTPEVTEVGAVAGVRAALQQVVTNLLVNAAESILAADTHPGRVVVSASHEELKGQAMMHLRFEDNGGGIQPDHLERLFERGFSTKNRDGSGHGLHWSAITVQKLGGHISAESTGVGRGACLHVWLPLAKTLIEKATGTDG